MSLAHRLFRRREVWLPTLWGALLLAALLALAGVVLAWQGYALMSPIAPAHGPDGRGARTMVVEGWMGPGELDRVIDLLGHGRYERVLTTGGPIEPWLDAGGWHTYAARAAGHLRSRLPNGLAVVAVPAPDTAQERTYLSAVVAREWVRAAQPPIAAVDLVTTGVHARRSWLLYRMAFGAAVEVGVVSTEPAAFDGRHWWRSSAGAKALIGEALGFGWTKCCFWPGPPGSPDELVGELRGAAKQPRSRRRTASRSSRAHVAGLLAAARGQRRAAPSGLAPAWRVAAYSPPGATPFQASASSSTSTQCLTGVVVPVCRCWMQPMLAETMVCASSGAKLASLRSRSW